MPLPWLVNPHSTWGTCQQRNLRHPKAAQSSQRCTPGMRWTYFRCLDAAQRLAGPYTCKEIGFKHELCRRSLITDPCLRKSLPRRLPVKINTGAFKFEELDRRVRRNNFRSLIRSAFEISFAARTYVCTRFDSSNTRHYYRGELHILIQYLYPVFSVRLSEKNEQAQPIQSSGNQQSCFILHIVTVEVANCDGMSQRIPVAPGIRERSWIRQAPADGQANFCSRRSRRCSDSNCDRSNKPPTARDLANSPVRHRTPLAKPTAPPFPGIVCMLRWSRSSCPLLVDIGTYFEVILGILSS
jgi:hypothetical protein